MAKSKLFRQVALKPGTYQFPGGTRISYSRDDLKSYVEGTRKALAAGKRISVFLEHPKPGSVEGGPLDEHDAKADRLRNTVGKLVAIDQEPDGSLSYVLEIAGAAAEKVADGHIRYTSPELRRTYRNGDGVEINNLVAHVALTNNPRTTQQGEFEYADATEAPALQFSLADYVEDQSMPRANPKKAAPKAKPTAKTPAGRKADFVQALSGLIAQFADDEKSEDVPPSETSDDDSTSEVPQPGSDKDQQVKACVAALASFDIVLPEDTNAENFIANLRAAVTALAAVKDSLNGGDDEPGPEESYMPPQEETTPRQFSLEDVTSGRLKKKNAVLAKLLTQTAAHVNAEIEGLTKSGTITPTVAKALRTKFNAVQFSADGDERPSFTLDEVVGLLRANSRADRFGNAQFAADEDEHATPGFFDAGEQSPLGPTPGSNRYKAAVAAMSDTVTNMQGGRRRHLDAPPFTRSQTLPAR